MVNSFLPGINVTLNDQGLKVAAPPAGPKVTILGITSNTGITIYEPYTVSSVDKAMNTLYFQTGDGLEAGSETGKYPGEMALAIESAIQAGAPNIEIIVINHRSGEVLFPYIDPTGAVKSGRYTDLSGAYDILRNRELDVVFPAGVFMDYWDESATFTDNFGKQLADFCYQSTMENNSCIGVIPTLPVLEWAWQHRFALMCDATFTGEVTGSSKGATAGTLSGEIVQLFPGFDSLSTEDLGATRANAIFGTPSAALVAEWYRYHSFPPSADNEQTAAGWVSAVSGQYNTAYRNWLHGAEDTAGNTFLDPTSVVPKAVHANYFTSWQAVDELFVNQQDGRGNKVDAAQYISIVSVPLKATSTQINKLALGLGASAASTTYSTSGGASYAGLINSLAPQSATTNKVMQGVSALKILSPRQANDLSLRRHVTMHVRSTGFTVTSGNTGAYRVSDYVRSDYVRLSTVRIAHAAVDLIRAVGDKYIGEPNNAPQLNALRAEIDQVLLSMKGSGALNAYDYVVSSTPDQRVLGKADINLTLVPAFELTEINMTVNLAKEL